jgi:V/A-type H+/Na+-transporting ATPase subunit F
MKFVCIADEDTVRGLRLAGIAGHVVTTAQQAAATFAKAAAGTDCGIIILTHNVATSIRQQVDTFRFQRDRPLIVEIPGPEGQVPERKNLRQFVQEAVGFKMDQEGT